MVNRCGWSAGVNLFKEVWERDSGQQTLVIRQAGRGTTRRNVDVRYLVLSARAAPETDKPDELEATFDPSRLRVFEMTYLGIKVPSNQGGNHLHPCLELLALSFDS